MNYRKFYKEQTGKEIPKNFDVHHLDLNRNNNSIDNLVAIPRELHQALHSCYNNIYLPTDRNQLLFKGNAICNNHLSVSYCLNYLVELSEINYKVLDWIIYRDFLRNLHPLINSKLSYEQADY